MKQTNNAIKFLMAQYRAIFNNAYFKGLATAALVTVAMAAGQAQAADGDLADFIKNSSKADVKGDFTLSKEESISDSDGGYLTNLTIANGGTLKFDGSATANKGHIHVYETLSVQSGGTLTLKEGSGTAGWGVIGATDQTIGANPDFKSTSKLDVNGGTVSIDKSQIHMASVVLNNAKVEIKNNIGSAADSNFADNAQISAHAVYNAAGKHIEGTGLFTVTGDKTKITLDSGSILNAAVFNFDGGAIDMKGDETAGSGAMIRAYSNGGKVAAEINFQGTDLNITDSGNYIGGKVVNLKTGSDIKLADKAELHLSGILDAAGDIAASKHAGTINLDGAAITLSGSKSKLIIDVEGSVFNANSGSIDNKGEITFNNKEVNTTAALLAGMAGGKITMASGGEINVTSGAVDISSTGLKFLQADGTVSGDKLELSQATTLNAADLTLGTAFKAENLNLKADNLKVGKDFAQTKGTITVANNLSGSGTLTVGDSGSVSTATLTLKDGGSVSGITVITVQGKTSQNGTLNITGTWTGLDNTSLTVGASGAANLANAADVSLKNLTVAENGALSIKDGSSLTVSGSVSTKDNNVSLTDNSKLSVKYAEANKSSALAKVSLDGSSTLVLTGYEPAGGSITLDQFGTIKSKFIGDTGLLELSGVTINSGVDQNADVAFDKAQSGTGAAGVFDTNTVTGVTGDVAGSNDWGTVELKQGQNELSVAAGGAVTLNGNGSNKLVADSTGATDAGVKLAAGSILTVEATGTIKEVTAANDGEGKFIVDGKNTVNVTNNLGSETKKLDTVNVIADSNLNVKNVYAKTLDLGGNLQATSVTLDDNSSITGSLKADSLVLADTKTLAVGEGADNGLLEVKSLDLKGGKLVLDPEFRTHASVAAINQTGDAAEDIVYVKANGDIGVGKNSVFAVGLTADAALEVLRSNGYLDENTSLIENKLGSAIVLDQGMSIAAGDAVFLDSTGNTDTLSKKITDKTTTLNNSGGYMELGANTGLVITGKLFDNATTQNKEIIQFAGTTNTTLQLNDGSKLVFDVTDAFGGDSIKLTNATTLSSNGTVNIEAANGMLVGTLDTTNKGVTFAIAQDAKDKLYNQSNPVKDLTYDVMAGNYKDSRDENGVAFIGAVNGQDGGKAVEETARLAVYGGAVQATNLAQQAANDAVVERMSRANPNGSLVFANNAQGGGLWLSPVYKSLESDSFDADGVDYGVDADLTGLVLGADFTAESGVRAGAYFNFGSASVDGQGVGDQVSNDADYFGFGLYTGMTFGQMSLVADAGFTQVSNDVEQNINHKDFSKAKASFDSSAVTLGLRGEYKLNVATMDVTPHLGVRYTRLAVDGYDAKVDGYTVATTDVDTMQMFAIPFGVTISKDIVAGSWTVKPVFDLTLTANAGDTDAKLDTTFIGTKTIGLTSEAFDSFTYGATVGIDAKYGENFSVGLNTNYVGSSNTDEFGVMGNVRYMF